ncbi:ABC transporter permease [Halobacteriales archaeon QS_1_68_20]|nr:MAG: ABC transporter permease [Halobacteriales archaeon QS_1_68_20]
MLELARFEGRRKLKGALALAVGLSLLAAMDVWVFPSVTASGVDLEQFVEAYPPALRRMMGIEAFGSIEGFLASQLYVFAWLILLGLYLAYSAASLIADDVERGRMDVTLSLPVTRSRVVAEKYLTLLVPVLVVNAVTPVVVSVGVALVGESISLGRLIAVHALSVPYLLATGGIGLLASVAFDRASVAQRVAMGVTFGLYLAESVLAGTDYRQVGLLAPSRYYDPTAILVRGEYDLAGAAILLGMVAVLVGASALWFGRKDVQ